jgi:Leucine-rich repeat (LRR) protein
MLVAAVSMLLQLKVLHLQHNCLATLPPAFYKLTKLEELNLSDNQLKELSIDISNFAQLHSLDVVGNNMSALPATAARLQLQHFDGARNDPGLSNLPLHLQQLQARGEIVRSKEKRRELVRRALRVKGRAVSVGAASG